MGPIRALGARLGVRNMPTPLALLILVTAPLGADDPPRPAAPAPAASPAFRITVRQFETDRRPVARGEIIVARGRAYYLESGSKEVIVLDPAAKAVHLIDLKMSVTADLPYSDIDAGLAEQREDQKKIIEAHARGKSRAERIDAEMRRDQLEPRFEPKFDEASRTLRMGNPSVQVEARGEPDDDPARFAATADTLTTLARLRARRELDDLGHLVQVETISLLVGGRKLRPAEITYLFKLAGPPEKHRQTFELIPELTPEDLQGLDLIEAQLPKARRVPFDRYNRRIDPDELKK
jgi:hypothetical protein